jgi:spermidine synthase
MSGRPSAALSPSLSWAFSLSLFFSGAAALAYQVLWVRELETILGTTLDAVATVLAVFMAGLGLGAMLAARFADRRSTRILPLAYATLETGTALFGLAFPLLLGVLSPLYRGLHPAGLAGVLLLVPTTLMGATLPTLTTLQRRALRDTGDVGRSAGILYASNTAGAVFGSLVTSLVLLPSAGIRLSLLGAAALNVLAGAVVLVMGRRIHSAETGPVSEEREPATSTRGSASRISAAVLVVAALSGLAALASEVAWTRSLVLVIGPTTYGLSFVVSAVIFGLAVGSGVAARWGGRRDATATATTLGWAQLGAALSSLAVILVLGRSVLPVGGLVHAESDAPWVLLALELLGIFVLLLPSSFFFGATFPLAVSVLAKEGRAPAAATGSVLLWNTAGALAGSLLAGFVSIPALGSESTLRAAALLHVGGAALLVAVSTRGARAVLRRLVPATGVALVVGGSLLVSRWDRELLSGGLYKYAPYMEPGEFLDFLRQGELVYFREDPVATVSVKRVGPRLSLSVDGKVDATDSADMLTQRMLGHLPLLLHPRPRDVLVIGLGSGVTAGAALAHPIENLEAVEISEGVAEASRLFDAASHTPTADPRFHLVVADGRNHLLVSNTAWDVIISEPSNPWMAGVSSLFTREFFALARSRLRPGGLFCQWAHLYNLSTEDLRTIVASFTDAYDEAALFLLSESDLLLVGAKDGFSPPSLDELQERLGRDRVREDLREVEIRGAYGLTALFTASTPALSAWAASAERHTDDRPVLEFRAARALNADTSRENRAALQSVGGDLGMVLPAVPDPTIDDLLCRGRMLERAESFEWAYDTFASALERDLLSQPAVEGLVKNGLASGRADAAETLLRELARGGSRVEPLLGLGLLYRSLGRLDEAVLAVSGALSLDPECREALILAIQIAGDRGETEAMANFARRQLAIDPVDAEAAALLAEASLREGDLELASARSAAILARRPAEPIALQVHAIAEAELGRVELARASFEKLIDLEPEGYIQLNNLGRLELDAGNAERAADLFERAVDASPRNLPGYQGLEQAAARAHDQRRLERARSMVRFLQKTGGAENVRRPRR